MASVEVARELANRFARPKALADEAPAVVSRRIYPPCQNPRAHKGLWHWGEPEGGSCWKGGGALKGALRGPRAAMPETSGLLMDRQMVVEAGHAFDGENDLARACHRFGIGYRATQGNTATIRFGVDARQVEPAVAR